MKICFGYEGLELKNPFKQITNLWLNSNLSSNWAVLYWLIAWKNSSKKFKLAIKAQWRGSTFFPIHQPTHFLQADSKLDVGGSLITLVISWKTICEILDKYNCFKKFSTRLVSGFSPLLMDILCLKGLWVSSFLWAGVGGYLSIFPAIGDTMVGCGMLGLSEAFLCLI